MANYYVPAGSAHFHTLDVAHAYDLQEAAGTQVTLMNGIAEGPDDNERTGKIILLKSLALRWHAFQNFQNGTTDNTMWPATLLVCIIKDTQPTASIPNYTDIFLDTTPMSFMNLQNTGRFKSVYRRIVYNGGNNPNTSAAAASPGIPAQSEAAWIEPPHDEFYKTMNEQIRFDNTGASVADIFDCAYYLVTCIQYHSDSAEPSNAASRFRFEAKTRVRYHDM